jgi:SH3 domain protein
MMKKLGFILFVALGFCLWIETSWAKTVYVTDSFEVPLRTGPSLENKIISLPTSGQPLEALNSEGDWTKVRILKQGSEGPEGWIPTRYLINRPPWEQQAKALKEENDALKGKLTDIEKQWEEAKQRDKELSQDLEDNSKALAQVRSQYEALKKGATDYLKLKESYGKTQSALETAQKSVQELTAENEKLSSSQRTRWFATGALVLLFGLMIGIVMGRQQKKRRSLYS